MLMEHEWISNGSLFAIKIADLEQGNVFQLQASREQLKEHPETDAVETGCTIVRSGYGKPPYTMVEGSSLRSKNRLLAKLDVSHVPCDNGRNPLQSFAWNLFHNDGIVIFYGSEAQLVRFWSSNATTDTKPQDNSKPIAPHTWCEPPTQCSFEVRTPPNERELHAQVVAALFGAFKNSRKAVDPTYSGHVYRAEYQSADSVALSHLFSMSGTTIVCANPNQLRQSSLIEKIEPSAPIHQRLMLAGMELGSKAFVSTLIEADERLHEEPLSAQHRTNIWSPQAVQHVSVAEMPGLLVHDDALEHEQEEIILNHLNEYNFVWDTSTRRKLTHFGFEFDHKGENIQPPTPIPSYSAEAHHLAAQLLLNGGLDHTLNQCTVAMYDPGVGVGEHLENPLLGKTVVTIGLHGSVPIVFVPRDGSDLPKTTLYHRQRLAIAITGECLQKWKHGIPSRMEDKVDGEKFTRPQRTALIFRPPLPPLFSHSACPAHLTGRVALPPKEPRILQVSPQVRSRPAGITRVRVTTWATVGNVPLSVAT